MGREGAGVSCESDEDSLADVFRQVHVSIHSPQRGVVNQSQMPADDLREIAFASARGIAAQQVGIIAHGFTG